MAGTVNTLPPIGTSDHKALLITFNAGDELPRSPARQEVYDWATAPWGHIRAEIKRAFSGWAPVPGDDIQAVEASMDAKLNTIVERYVKRKIVARQYSTLWWDRVCEETFQHKLSLRLFEAMQHRADSGVTPSLHAAKEYRKATMRCKKAQRWAFAKYNRKLKVKLEDLGRSDKNFWKITKEISGLEANHSSAAPDAEALVSHFATKMSNGRTHLCHLRNSGSQKVVALMTTVQLWRSC